MLGLGGGGDVVLALLMHTTHGMAMTALQPSLKMVGWIVGGMVDREWCRVPEGAPEAGPECVPFEYGGPEVAREMGVRSVDRAPSGTKMDCEREIAQVVLIRMVLEIANLVKNRLS